MYKSIDSSRIRNLKLISKLKIGDKLCTRSHHYSIDAFRPISFNSIYRIINGESRTETIDSITLLVESCINQHGVSVEERKRLANEFKGVVKGITNLGLTYKDDSTAMVGLELIKEMLLEYIKINGTEDVEDTSLKIIEDGIVEADEIELDTEEVESNL